MRKRTWLLIWAATIIFPMTWLVQAFPRFWRPFRDILSPDWIHVVMHTLQYAGLVVLLLAAFELNAGWRTAGISLLAVLTVAIAQEGLQVISSGLFPVKGTVFDLGVDFLGGCVGYGLTLFVRVAKELFWKV